MKVTAVEVGGLAYSIVASGFAKLDRYDASQFRTDVDKLDSLLTRSELLGVAVDDKHFKRAARLGKMPTGSGHCTYLAGITVTANITATVKWWEQFQRYHFKQIITSMSTMHMLREMVDNKTLEFDHKTSKDVIDSFLSVASKLKDDELAYSCPTGLLLTGAIATNYLQLKNIWEQRHNHKLEEWWGDFCPWVTSLPFFTALTGINNERRKND